LSLSERLTGIPWRDQKSVLTMALGHGSTHWAFGTFYVLLPFIAKHLGLSYAEAGLLVAVYHLSGFTASIGSGVLIDVIGRQALFQVIALLMGAFALLALGLTGEFLIIAILITFIGAGANLWHPAAISYLSSRFPNNRGYTLSIHAFGANVGDALAPLVAGIALVWFTWQGAAVINALPLFVATTLVAIVLSREKSAGRAPSDQGMSMSEYFVQVKGVIRDKAVLGLCTMAAFRTMTQNGLFVFLPLYLADVIKVSPLTLGFTLSALQIGGLIAAPIAGTASDHVGRRPVVIAALSASTVLIIILTFIESETVFVAGVSLLGFAMFAMRPVIHSWLMDLTPPRMGGSATSLLFGTQAGLSTITPALGGIIADTWGLTSVFYFLAGTMMVANILVFMLPQRESQLSTAAD
jgi:MFS family permease